MFSEMWKISAISFFIFGYFIVFYGLNLKLGFLSIIILASVNIWYFVIYDYVGWKIEGI